MVHPEILEVLFNVFKEVMHGLVHIVLEEGPFEPSDQEEPLVQSLLVLVPTLSLDGHDDVYEARHHDGKEGDSTEHDDGTKNLFKDTNRVVVSIAHC